MHNVEFFLKVGGDRGGVQPHHLAEMLRVGIGEGFLTLMAETVDGRQQHGVDACLEGTDDRLVAIGVKGFVVEVAVGVNHFLSCWRSRVNSS